MSLEPGEWESDSDNGFLGYLGVAVLVALYSVTKYGWLKGLAIALGWGFIMLYYVFIAWWI
jgi:hypothetical protein